MNTMWVILIIAMLAAVIVPAMPAHAVQNVKEVLPLDLDGRFSVSMVAGAVTVEGWDKDQVEITGTLDDEAELKLSTSSKVVSVRVEYPNSELKLNRGRGDDCSLIIKVPRSATVEADCVSAGIVVRDVHGSVHAESVSGGIDVSGAPRDVEIKAVSGDMRVQGARNEVRVDVVSGSIDIELKGGGAYVQSVSGRIKIRGEGLSRVDASSVSGGVDFEGRLARNARFDINSHSGRVDARLIGDVSAQLSLNSFSGSIESELGGEVVRESKFTPKKQLEHTIGEGDARVTISTFSGSIRVMK